MWINKAQWERQTKNTDDGWKVAAEATGRATRLEIENARLRADMDWFKLRLNQVERERGQLIQAAIGVKIAVPEFVPTYENPGAALNEMPDLSTVGHDAVDDSGGVVRTSADPGEGVDYSMMPGYTGDKR